MSFDKRESLDKLLDDFAHLIREHERGRVSTASIAVARSGITQLLAPRTAGRHGEVATVVTAALVLAQAALRRWTELYAHLQNECGEVVSRKLDHNLPPADHLRALEAIEIALPLSKVPSATAAIDREHVEATLMQFLSKVLTVRQIQDRSEEINALFSDLLFREASSAEPKIIGVDMASGKDFTIVHDGKGGNPCVLRSGCYQPMQCMKEQRCCHDATPPSTERDRS